MANQVCPYCGKAKPPEQFSKEHVIPRSLGGNLEPDNPFAIKCCIRCNRACGKFVEAPFVRSWFLHSARANAARVFIDPACKPTLPLHYLGEIHNWGETNRVCDFYLGPGGDHIYHVHQPYQDDPVLVGGPPVLPGERDAGLVVIGVVSTNPALQTILVRSARAAFKGASLHELVAGVDGRLELTPAAEGEDGLVSLLPLHVDPARRLRVSVDVNSGDRFLVKLGLGVGTALFRRSFVESAAAAILREALWARETDEWPESIRGTPFFNDGDGKLTQLLNWNGCHLLLVGRQGDGVGMMFAPYGKYCGAILLDSSEHYGVDDALVWVIAPGLRRYAGPMSLLDYVAARVGGRPGPLASLRAHIDQAIELPSPHLPFSPMAST